MARRQLLVRSEAREKILHGCLALADAVRVTLGPQSKCVLIGKKWRRPIACNDGVRNIAAGGSDIDLKRGLDRGLRMVVARLRELSRPVADHKQRVQVATVSAHNEQTIGEIVAASGFDASRGTCVDLVDAGIIDPTKVVRSALENAVSVASVLLLTESTLTEIRDSKTEQAPAGEMA